MPDDTYVEPAHDALVRAWDKLLVWKAEFGADLYLQRRVNQAANDWRRAEGKSKAKSLWHNNSRLARLEDLLLPKTEGNIWRWIQRRIQYLWPTVIVTGQPTWLNQVETEFVKASIVWRARNLRNAILTTLTVLIALASLTFYAFFQQRQATSSADAANAQLALEAGHGDQAITLALKANAIDYPPAEAQQTLLDVAYYAPGMTRRRLADHTGSVNAVTFSPRSSKLALSASSDKTLILWDLATGATVRRLAGHTDAVNGVAFSPDGSYALSGSSDHSLILWEIDSGQVITHLVGHSDAVTSVAFSTDGTMAASGSTDTTVILWDFVGGRAHPRTQLRHPSKVTSVSFSPIQPLLVAGCADGILYVWDVNSGKVIRMIEWHNYEVTSVAFSPNGQTIFAGAGGWGLRLWSVDGAQLLSFPPAATIGHISGTTSVAFSPDGHLAISASNDKSLILWRMDNGASLQHFWGHDMDVMSVAFSPDGRRVLSGDAEGSVRLWDIGSGAELRRIAKVGDWALSPDDHTVLYVSREPLPQNNSLMLWDIEGGAPPQNTGIGNDIISLAFAPDGQSALLGLGSGDVAEFVIKERSIARVYTQLHPGWVNSIALSTDGNKVLSGSYCRDQHSPNRDCRDTLLLWDRVTGEVIYHLDGHSNIVRSVDFSPDDTKGLSSSADGTIILWDVKSGEPLRQMLQRGGDIETIVFSPDGSRALSGSSDLTVRLWDVNTGQELRRFMGHTAAIMTVDFSPDGYMVLSGAGDMSLRLWDVETGMEIGRFMGHSGPVKTGRFRANGRMILSRGWSGDDTLRLWQLPPSDLIGWTHENRYVPEN